MRKGSVMVEAALLIPLLLFLFVTILAYGARCIEIGQTQRLAHRNAWENTQEQ